MGMVRDAQVAYVNKLQARMLQFKSIRLLIAEHGRRSQVKDMLHNP